MDGRAGYGQRRLRPLSGAGGEPAAGRLRGDRGIRRRHLRGPVPQRGGAQQPRRVQRGRHRDREHHRRRRLRQSRRQQHRRHPRLQYAGPAPAGAFDAGLPQPGDRQQYRQFRGGRHCGVRRPGRHRGADQRQRPGGDIRQRHRGQRDGQRDRFQLFLLRLRRHDGRRRGLRPLSGDHLRLRQPLLRRRRLARYPRAEDPEGGHVRAWRLAAGHPLGRLRQPGEDRRDRHAEAAVRDLRGQRAGPGAERRHGQWQPGRDHGHDGPPLQPREAAGRGAGAGRRRGMNPGRARAAVAAAMARAAAMAIALAMLLLAAGCGERRAPVFHETPPERLSEWGLVLAEGGRLVPNERVLPYTLNMPLFSDYAQKLRTVWMPEGRTARYRATGDWDFPVGTVLTKTFYYPVAGPDAVYAQAREPLFDGAALALERVRLVETRLLVNQADGWEAYPYVWNEAQTEATLRPVGDMLALRLVAADGRERPFTYVVPDANQCGGCHRPDHTSKELRPLGPKTRHLNAAGAAAPGGDQLAAWTEAGYLAGAPPAAEAPRLARRRDTPPR